VRPVWFIVEPNREQLVAIGKLVDAGHLKVAVDRVMALEQAGEAYQLAQ
jgi:NADPH:quinone reductase-like Zn-dependent oxidoreductase